MLWTIRKIVGDAVYTSEVHNAWIRVYSRMLSLMVPLAVKFEMETEGVRQEERIRRESAGLGVSLDHASNLASACASPPVMSPTAVASPSIMSPTAIMIEPSLHLA